MLKKLFLVVCAIAICLGCSSNDDGPAELQEVTFEVLSFEFIPDTGNNTNRLSYEIRFTNPNDVEVSGPYQVEVSNGALIQVRAYGEGSTCSVIAANASCTFTDEEEASLDNGFIPSRELVSVSYFITPN